MARMIRRWLRKLLFVLYLFVVISILLEVGVRLWGYSERHIYDPIYMPFAQTPLIPYVHKPNLFNARARGLAFINTDSLGLRSKTGGERYGSRPDQEYRIAIVGDSVTFGEGVERTEDTFPQVLEDILNQKQSVARVKVFNYAASAYSVKVMAATLPSRMLEVEPNLVIMAIVPTDFNLSRTPSVDSRGYLTDNRMSGFLAKDSSLRPVLRKIHLLYLLRDAIYPLLDRSEKEEDVLARGGLPESYAYVKQFAETAGQRKLAYRIALLPSLRHRFGNLPAQLHQDGLSLVDLSTLRDEFTKEQFQSSTFDTHPSRAVHHRVGESLASYILENCLPASN
jgi:hypothetical protein